MVKVLQAHQRSYDVIMFKGDFNARLPIRSHSVENMPISSNKNMCVLRHDTTLTISSVASIARVE